MADRDSPAPSLSRKTRPFAGASFLLIVGLAQAAPPELASLQKSYTRKVAEVAAPAATAFITKLGKIASSQAALGGYQEAAATRSKASATLAFLESLKASSGSALLLPLGEASNSGPVSYNADTGTLGLFTREGARASWDLRQITPGTYNVFLTYSVNHRDHDERLEEQGIYDQQEAGGSFQVREVTRLLRSDSAANSITHTVASTGGWEAYRSEIIGSISLASTSATIVLEALAPEPQGLMQLREIRLIPQPDRPARPTTTNRPTKSLASLKRDHDSLSAPILAPLIAAHSAEITSIKNAAAAAGDTKTVRRATRALAEFSDDAGKPDAPARAHASPPITLAAVDDLKVQLAGTATANASRSYLADVGPAGGGAITWQLPPSRPDTQYYQASIRQRPTTRSGGRLALTAGNNEISHYLDRPKEKKLDNATFEDTPLGTLQIPAGAAAVQLRVQSLDPDSDTLADLESLTLQPLDDATSAQKEIDRQDRLRQEEIEHAAQGWEAIRGATYIATDSARASAFRIRTASGETRDIVLYGITSPRPDHSGSEEDLEELETARWQLKLDKNDVERIGRKALKLVEETLATGRCTIFTRGKAKGGYTFAIVSTAGGTPLSINLANEGLASDSFRHGNETFPNEIHPDLSPRVYGRWINGAIDRARRSKKGLWENWR